MFRFQHLIVSYMIIKTCFFNMHTQINITKFPPLHFLCLAEGFKALVIIFFFIFLKHHHVLFTFISHSILNFHLPQKNPLKKPD